MAFMSTDQNTNESGAWLETMSWLVKRYAYTPREKFDKLKEKNPLIEKLRKEFDLDV